MRHFHKIGNTNVGRLAASISRQDLWHDDTYLRDYPQGPFGEVDSIILRFPARSVHETEQALAEHMLHWDQHECHDLPAYAKLPEAYPLVMDLMGFVRGERLGRVMINRLKPGGRIFPHADTPVHAEYWTRHHICIQGSAGCIFRCADEQIIMQTGDIWQFDNRLEHEVVNNGSLDRISMVVDIRTKQ